MAAIGEFETRLEGLLADQDGSLVLNLRVPKHAAHAARQTVTAIKAGRDMGKERLKARLIWHSDKRSLCTNSYFHVLVDKIAEAVGAGSDEIKHKVVLEYGVPRQDEHGDDIIAPLPKSVDASTCYPYAKWIGDFEAKNGKEYSQYKLYKQTHTMSKSEMARLIDGVVGDAKDLDIETKTPQELASLLDKWEGYE